MEIGPKQQKAISIEVGMQNSGLGATLANSHFNPLAAVPSTIFSVWHNITGSIIATINRKQQEKEANNDVDKRHTAKSVLNYRHLPF